MARDVKTLRETMDKLKDKLGTAVIVLAVWRRQGPDRCRRDRQHHGQGQRLVNWSTSFAGQVGGKGGGKPDMAMAGGTNAAQLPQALASVHDWVAAKL